ncbi:MAG: CoA-binding protein [Spirochaetia bacterium]|nr:CoA-binding protein [Spirochaetia bacterium]
MGTLRRVVILGASNKPDRYAYKALKELAAAGYEVIPVNPVLKEVEGIKVTGSLAGIKSDVDTIALYVGPQSLAPMVNDIVALKPKRIIANPGTELGAMREAAQKNGIEYVEGCTLVMLRTNTF